MTATVTTLQNAFLSTLQTLAGNSPPVAFTPRIAEADEAQLAAIGASADVLIGYESSARLGRTGNMIIEQYLIPITIKHRYAVNSNSDLAANHSLAEVIRDTLAAYHTSTVRVDQLLSPHPFDAPLAVGPGQYAHKFVLDCDVLRTNSAITQDSTTPAKVLTKVRRAAWNAINNWSEFDSNTWARKFQNDADLDELALHDPGEFDLPALAVTLGPTSPRFFTHINQEWPVTLNVTAWFPAHQTTLAEYRAWQIVRAIYQSADPSTPTVSYIRAATGRIPEKDSPISFDPVELGRSQQLKALKVTCQFVLTGIVAPLQD